MTIGPDDVAAVGGALDADRVLDAYRRGIFPWPLDEDTLLWFCPRRRAVLERQHLHVPRSLRRAARRSSLRFTIDADFAGVIDGCAATPRPGQDGTWITRAMREAYVALHARGVTHSVEAWRDDRLVGGIYGVDVDGAFAGESMFHREPDASKLALLVLLDHLFDRGLDWMDVQVLNPHLARFGAREIPRADFLARLAATRARGLVLFA